MRKNDPWLEPAVKIFVSLVIVVMLAIIFVPRFLTSRAAAVERQAQTAIHAVK